MMVAGLELHSTTSTAGVVKLGGLADDNGAGADNQDFFDTCIQRH